MIKFDRITEIQTIRPASGSLDLLKIYAGSPIDHVDRLPIFSAGK